MSNLWEQEKLNLPSGLGFAYDDWLGNQRNQREIYRKNYEALQEMKRGYSDFLAKQGLEMNPTRSWLTYDSQLAQLQQNIRTSEFVSNNSLMSSLGFTNGYGVFKVPKNVYRWL